MVDLSTTYLGMNLRTPLVPSASPLSENIDGIKRMEDAGAAAVVLYSLFEEQLTSTDPESSVHHEIDETSPRASGPFPRQSSYRRRPEEHLDHIRKAKEAVAIPVIASLNATSIGGWTRFAKQIEQAGADALELNIYNVQADLRVTGAQVEDTDIEIVREVRSGIAIPVAVKIGPYFSSVANMAVRFEEAGAGALVLFNRFYQPDINMEGPWVTPRILLSTAQDMRLPLRWIAILSGRVHLDLAATGGIHEGYDVMKMLMAGASITQLCSVLMRRGINYIQLLEAELQRLMQEHNYESVAQIRGILSQKNYPDPSAFERAHYIRSLQSYDHPTSPVAHKPR